MSEAPRVFSCEDDRDDFARVERAVTTLMEHFDGVQIFAQRKSTDGGGVFMVDFGGGNYFGRYGQTEQWVQGEQEKARMRVRGAPQ